ncbi:acyl-ACP--UDP-N-acetylglucosamine O-acyltransferase [Candidatus Binatia bacterium]|nr:acyl-ACP--UDP-N-acetylglucosamine O-acyltransferase [Candidatus Binatia bacterium]
MPIHPTAVVDPLATIDPSAVIGPFVVVEGPARIGPGTRLGPHVTVTGWTTLGADNIVHAGARLGDAPQDLAYGGGESFLRVGDRNVIREGAQLHRGTGPGSETLVGDDNFFMTNAHIGHNCRLGNHVIMATGATLGGHVRVEDHVFISGNCVVHQFVRIGRLALLRGLSRASRDVPPFCIMDGTHTVRAVNRVGLRRAGFSSAQVRALHAAFRTLFRRARNLQHAIAAVEATPCTDEVRELLDFIRTSTRGVCRGSRQGGADGD